MTYCKRVQEHLQVLRHIAVGVLSTFPLLSLSTYPAAALEGSWSRSKEDMAPPGSGSPIELAQALRKGRSYGRKKSEHVDSGVDPLNYKLSFDIDLNQSRLGQSGEITFRARRQFHDIQLAGSQPLADVYVADQEGEEGADVRKVTVRSNGTIALMLRKALDPGTYILHFKSVQILPKEPAGLFRETVEDGKDLHYFACTLIDPDRPGCLFPCLGDPNAAAPIQISCLVEKSVDAISNMKVISRHDRGDKTLVGFERSPEMRSYLAALVVGPFQSIPEHMVGEMAVNYFSLSQNPKLPGGEMLSAIIRNYRAFCGDEYPLHKLDIVSLPDRIPEPIQTVGLVLMGDRN